MTVRELELWIQSARRESDRSGQTIDDYEVEMISCSGRVNNVGDAKVDHGRDTLALLPD